MDLKYYKRNIRAKNANLVELMSGLTSYDVNRQTVWEQTGDGLVVPRRQTTFAIWNRVLSLGAAVVCHTLPYTVSHC